MNPLSNARAINEPFDSYRARLRAVNKAIKLHLRGRMAHVSTETVVLPMTTEDLKVDEQVRQGKYRDVKIIPAPSSKRDRFGRVLPSGKQIRIGRTKGVTFRKKDQQPKPNLARKFLSYFVPAALQEVE